MQDGSGNAQLGIPGVTNASLIGSGGSAKVYRATQTQLGRDVAVKVLLGTAPAEQKQFDREARALGRLASHPGIVTVYDAGFTEQGDPFLLLEYCVGGSLGDQLENGTFEWTDAVSYLAPVADTLAHAHAQNFVHRDLKPGNILLNDQGQPLVADFGLARTIDAESSIGPSSIAAFTPGYVPPETISGHSVSTASDVYSLGGTLFSLLTGSMPFVDTDAEFSLLALARRITDDPVPDLRPQGIPEPVCQLIEAAMAKDPMARPSASELAEQLRALAGEPSTAGPESLGTDTIVPRDSTIHLSAEQMAMPLTAAIADAMGPPTQHPQAMQAAVPHSQVADQPVAPTASPEPVVEPVQQVSPSPNLARSKAVLRGILVGVAILGLVALGVVGYLYATGDGLSEITFNSFIIPLPLAVSVRATSAR